MLAKVYSEDKYIIVELPESAAIEANKEKIMKKAETELDFKNPIGCDFIPKDHHVCQYCGDITPGINDDLLCVECRSIFGHSRFSEL